MGEAFTENRVGWAEVGEVNVRARIVEKLVEDNPIRALRTTTGT